MAGPDLHFETSAFFTRPSLSIIRRRVTSRRWLEIVVKKANVANFSSHCIRYTFASRLVMAGADLRTVQELLGHKVISMTIRYAHLAPKHTRGESDAGPMSRPLVHYMLFFY